MPWWCVQLHIIMFHVVTGKRFLWSAPHTFSKYILLVGGTNINLSGYLAQCTKGF